MKTSNKIAIGAGIAALLLWKINKKPDPTKPPISNPTGEKASQPGITVPIVPNTTTYTNDSGAASSTGQAAINPVTVVDDIVTITTPPTITQPPVVIPPIQVHTFFPEKVEEPVKPYIDPTTYGPAKPYNEPITKIDYVPPTTNTTVVQKPAETSTGITAYPRLGDATFHNIDGSIKVTLTPLPQYRASSHEDDYWPNGVKKSF